MGVAGRRVQAPPAVAQPFGRSDVARVPKPKGVCACGKVEYSGGRCRACYSKHWRATRVARLCTHPGCGEPVEAKALCRLHYDRVRTRGTPDKLRRPEVYTQVERFWANVDKDGPVPEHMPHLGPCWVWLGRRRAKGYGVFLRGSDAHHFSWVVHNGPVPARLWVLHRCDNPSCVRPSHLFVGTPSDNVQDMLAKGRGHYQ